MKFLILQTLPRMSAHQGNFFSSARNIVSKCYWRESLSNSMMDFKKFYVRINEDWQIFGKLLNVASAEFLGGVIQNSRG